MRISFDPTSLEAARSRIAMLFDAFVRLTGIPTTLLSEIVSDDRAFVSRYRRSNMTFATYDRVAGRFSTIWPVGAAWPDHVPRPAPVEIPEALREKIIQHQRRKSRLPGRMSLPGDAAWPEDIPLPSSCSTVNMEKLDGQEAQA